MQTHVVSTLSNQAPDNVVGVASKKTHEMVKSLGASACFDQKDPTLVEGIVIHLNGKEVVGGYAATINDLILNAMCEILDRSGGRKLLASVALGTEGKATRAVQIVTGMSTNIARSEIGKPTCQWLSKAMEENRIKYTTQSEVVGKGLEQV